MNTPTLLPIGTRVTHFDGGPSSHGTGTIVAHNGIPVNAYLQERPQDTIELAFHVSLNGALVDSMYDNVRCPYVVQWDYRQDFFDRFPELKEQYPNGYCDVYEALSINAVEGAALVVFDMCDKIDDLALDRD